MSDQLSNMHHVWSPYHVCDVTRVESVQRSFTKRLPGFRDTDYKSRLLLLGLDSLELRRLRQDLIFTILHIKFFLDWQMMLQVIFLLSQILNMTREVTAISCILVLIALICENTFLPKE